MEKRYNHKLIKVPLLRRIRKALCEIYYGYCRAVREIGIREEIGFVEIKPGGPEFENAGYQEVVFKSKTLFPIGHFEDMKK